jgi:hypothetical protein
VGLLGLGCADSPSLCHCIVIHYTMVNVLLGWLTRFVHHPSVLFPSR